MSATASEWATITNVSSSSLFNRIMSSITSPAFSLSRLPVGSSAQTISGRLTSALAMVTRGCCPPDSSAG